MAVTAAKVAVTLRGGDRHSIPYVPIMHPTVYRESNYRSYRISSIVLVSRELKGKSRKYTCGPPYVGHHSMKSDGSRQDLVVTSKTWRVWPDRIFPSSPPPFARACAFTEYGLVHETTGTRSG